MYQLAKTEAAVWTAVADGIELLLKPGGTDALMAARREVRLAVRDDPEVETGIPFVFGFVCWGAEDWRGIGEKPDDAREDAPLTPVPFSTEALGRLLRQRPDIYQRLDDEYVGPVLELLSEKKGSSPSPNGISAAAPPTATPVQSAAKTKATAPPAPTARTKPEA